MPCILQEVLHKETSPASAAMTATLTKKLVRASQAQLQGVLPGLLDADPFLSETKKKLPDRLKENVPSLLDSSWLNLRLRDMAADVTTDS